MPASEPTLVEFVTARLDEWEAGVRGPGLLRTLASGSPDPTLRDIAGREDRRLYARTLREVEAMRRIVAWCAPRTHDVPGAAEASTTTARFVLGMLASIWADHPDYKETWRA